MNSEFTNIVRSTIKQRAQGIKPYQVTAAGDIKEAQDNTKHVNPVLIFWLNEDQLKKAANVSAKTIQLLAKIEAKKLLLIELAKAKIDEL